MNIAHEHLHQTDCLIEDAERLMACQRCMVEVLGQDGHCEAVSRARESLGVMEQGLDSMRQHRMDLAAKSYGPSRPAPR
jgi:hypothetical protein